MTERRIVMTGMGHYFPETELDNQFFDDLDIGSSASWIDDRVGIKTRYTILAREDIVALRQGKTTIRELYEAERVRSIGSICQRPWEITRERAGLEADQPVDVMICGTSVPDWDIPANACSIAHELDIKAGVGFDCNSACSSFVVNLHVARGLLGNGSGNSALIVNPERYSLRCNYEDRASAILFGDSAAAAYVEVNPAAGKRGLELLDTVVHSDPTGAPHVKVPYAGTFSQNGKAVQKFAITKTVASALEVLERNNLRPEDLSYFAGHQANLRMLSSAADRLGLKPEQHLYNVNTKGNQGGSGAPTVLSTNWDKYQPGQLIVVSVVGSGLTWGAALFRCTG